MLDEHVNNLIRDKRLPGSVGRRLVPIHREDAGSSSLALATARIALVNTWPMSVEAGLTSSQTPTRCSWSGRTRRS
jgi:hypothetical protein